MFLECCSRLRTVLSCSATFCLVTHFPAATHPTRFSEAPVASPQMLLLTRLACPPAANRMSQAGEAASEAAPAITSVLYEVTEIAAAEGQIDRAADSPRVPLSALAPPKSAVHKTARASPPLSFRARFKSSRLGPLLLLRQLHIATTRGQRHTFSYATKSYFL